MIGLCLGLAGAVWAELPTPASHPRSGPTIHREDPLVINASPPRPGARRGAGIEGFRRRNGDSSTAPELRNGSWHYQRQLPPLQPLRVGRTPEAGDYQLCIDQRCRPMSDWLGPPQASQPALEL